MKVDRYSASDALTSQKSTDQARIFEGNTQKPFGIQAVTLNLTSEVSETRPYKINFPFKALYVQTCTDSSVSINFKPETEDSYQSSVALALKDVIKGDYPIASANLWWPAQNGKSITLVFFTELDFTSGSFVSQITGGVNFSNGNVIADSVVALAATTSTVLLASNTSRKQARIKNMTGDLIYLGTSPASENSYPLADGYEYTHANTAAIYAYAAAAGNVHIIEET